MSNSPPNKHSTVDTDTEDAEVAIGLLNDKNVLKLHESIFSHQP